MLRPGETSPFITPALDEFTFPDETLRARLVLVDTTARPVVTTIGIVSSAEASNTHTRCMIDEGSGVSLIAAAFSATLELDVHYDVYDDRSLEVATVDAMPLRIDKWIWITISPDFRHTGISAEQYRAPFGVVERLPHDDLDVQILLGQDIKSAARINTILDPYGETGAHLQWINAKVVHELTWNENGHPMVLAKPFFAESISDPARVIVDKPNVLGSEQTPTYIANTTWTPTEADDRAPSELTHNDDIVRETEHPSLDDLKTKVAHISDTKLRQQYLEILQRYRTRFHVSGYIAEMREYPGGPPITFTIEYSGDPIQHRCIPAKVEILDEAWKQLDEQTAKGLIKPVPLTQLPNLPCVTRSFFHTETRTDLDGNRKTKLRRIEDFSSLNEGLPSSQFSLPNIEQLTASVAGSEVYHAFDLASAYNQIRLENAHFATFIVPGRTRNADPCLFQPTRLGFGLKSSPSSFSVISGKLTAGVEEADAQGNPLYFTRSYLDDLTIAVRQVSAGPQALERFLAKAEFYNACLSWSKTKIAAPKINLLGSVISKNGVHPDPGRIDAIMHWDLPQTSKQLRSYLGLYNYIARFLPQPTTADTAYLHTLCQSRSLPLRSAAYRDAFERSKQTVGKYILLAPIDPMKPFIIQTDSSNVAMGAVLAQEHTFPGASTPIRCIIATFGKKWGRSAINLHSTDLELGAIISGLQRFRPLLGTNDIVVETDNKASIGILSRSTMYPFSSAKFARFRTYVASLPNNITLAFVAGKHNVLCDAISRSPRYYKPTAGPLVNVAAMEVSLPNLDVQAIVLTESWYHELLVRQKEDAFCQEQFTRLAKSPVDPEEQYLIDDGQYGLPNILRKKLVTRHTDAFPIVLPELLVYEFLFVFHRTGIAQGIGAAWRRIRLHCYWPGMTADITGHIAACPECKLAKARYMEENITWRRRPLSQVFQRLSCDVLTFHRNISTSDTVYFGPSCCSLLVMMCDFTSFMILVPVPNEQANTIVSAIRLFLVAPFGCPDHIIVDQGKCFQDSNFKDLVRQLNARITFTYRNYPQGNARNERSHAQIINAVRQIVDHRYKSWAALMPTLAYTLNITPREGMTVSPFELVFCRKPRPITPLGDQQDSAMKMLTPADMVILGDLSKKLREEYKLRLEQTYARQDQLRRQRRHVAFPPLKTNDRCYVIYDLYKDRTQKHFNRALGPYRITDMDDSSFTLLSDLPNHGNTPRTPSRIRAPKSLVFPLPESPSPPTTNVFPYDPKSPVFVAALPLVTSPSSSSPVVSSPVGFAAPSYSNSALSQAGGTTSTTAVTSELSGAQSEGRTRLRRSKPTAFEVGMFVVVRIKKHRRAVGRILQIFSSPTVAADSLLFLHWHGTRNTHLGFSIQHWQFLKLFLQRGIASPFIGYRLSADCFAYTAVVNPRDVLATFPSLDDDLTLPVEVHHFFLANSK